jgi:hypothetical protein
VTLNGKTFAIEPNERNQMKKSLLLIVAVALTAFTVQAQDWAKARLEKSPRHPEFVNVKHGDREVNCLIVYPEVASGAACAAGKRAC